MIICQAFIESELEIPRRLARRVHDLYFSPQYPGFEERTFWSLSNEFTTVFKDLDPIPQFCATAKLGGFSRCLFQAELLKPYSELRPLEKWEAQRLLEVLADDPLNAGVAATTKVKVLGRRRLC